MFGRTSFIALFLDRKGNPVASGSARIMRNKA